MCIRRVRGCVLLLMAPAFHYVLMYGDRGCNVSPGICCEFTLPRIAVYDTVF
jgi:hypothetical protein